MKRWIQTGLFTLLLVFAGSAVYASTSNHYAELIKGEQEKMENELKFYYTDRMNADKDIVDNTIMEYLEVQDGLLRNRATKYLHEKIDESQQEEIDEHKKAIDAKVEEMEKELKAYVDELVK